MRTFHKYINRNRNQECQLITALNAYYYLTGKIYCEMGDETYESLVNLCGAVAGTSICIERVYKKLGIKVVGELDSSIYLNEALSEIKLPLEMNVWHKKTGFHSTLVVGYSKQTKALQVANFRHVTTIDGWMFVEDIYQYTSWRLSDFKFFGLKNKGYKRMMKGLEYLGILTK